MSYKIGLIGLAGSGKDTVAVILQEALKDIGQEFEIALFAGLLKETAKAVFGDNFDDRDVKEVLIPFTFDLKLKVIVELCNLAIKLNLTTQTY
ncbi:hypothetical protein AB2T91_21095, partial [Clostridium butyricum]|uniref:hypothetical protein n=1 Tax=Clostridium butyricum TaxID=1492 RepID=UPI00346586FC